jgi:purine-binding chemotaxis protein CheW
MVDLVKIRRKAKEKKESAANPEESSAEETPSEETSPEPVSKAPKRESDPPKSGEAKKAVKTQPPVEKEPSKRSAAKAAAKAAPKPSPEGKTKAVETPKAGTKDEARPPQEVDEAVSVPDEIVDASGEAPDEESLDRLERFKREAGKRRTWTAAAAKTGPTVEEEEGERDLELLRFRLAGEEYAVDIEKIVEIVPPRGTTRVPNADPSIVGIMSLRGTIVTVFDLRRKLGHPPIGGGEDTDRRLIVVEREGETAGFLVDKVSRVVKLGPSEIENHPVVSAAEQSDYVGGVFQSSDGLVILLDLEKILAS